MKTGSLAAVIPSARRVRIVASRQTDVQIAPADAKTRPSSHTWRPVGESGAATLSELALPDANETSSSAAPLR